MTINLSEIAQWWNLYGFQAMTLSYLAVYFFGVFLLFVRQGGEEEEVVEDAPKKSCAPYAVIGIILLVTGFLAVFGGFVPWVTFELQVGCMAIAATLLVVIIYWAALA